MTRFFCDYLKFTLPRELTDNELEAVCKDLFGYPFHRFDRLPYSRDRYGDCYSLSGLVSVYRNGLAKNWGTTCFDISAAGLRELQQIDVVDLCRYVLDNDGNICRLDVTADDTDGILPFDEMAVLSTGENFKNRIKTKLCRNRTDKDTGEKIQVLPEISTQPRRIRYGSEQSDNYLVIYDAEFCHGVSYPWLRVELRLTNRADTLALAYLLTTVDDPAPILAGIIKDKLNFLQADKAKKQARTTMPWWDKFLQGATAVKLKREPTTKDSKQESILSNDVIMMLRAFDRLKSQRNVEGLQFVLDAINQDSEAHSIAWPDVGNF